MRIEPLEQRIAPASFVVSTLADSGDGSLRKAILDSNATPEADTITFSTTGTIAPLSPLPVIAGDVLLDATTAPGFAGLPVVGLNGANAGQAAGLDVTGSAVIKGLAIGGFSGAGIVFDGATGTNSIQKCFLGTNMAGSLAVPNSVGVVIFNTPGVTITNNLISGNTGDGIVIYGAPSFGNTITGNGIGTDATGLRDLGNGGAGIFINDAPSNLIGGAGTGNTIGGNGGAGINVSGANAAHNSIRGNVIGGNVSASAALPNDGDGVFIHNGASDTTVGGLDNASRNLISGNRGNGVRIEDASLTTVQNNFIGSTGTVARANGLSGVAILGASHDNLIGGDRNQNLSNLISGNSGAGVLIAGTATHNIVGGNIIGVAASSAVAIPNATGISIEGHAAENLIGGSDPLRNLISGNTGDGIRISSDGAGQAVQINLVGILPNNAVVPNGGNGILLQNTSGNLIGGDATQRNFISGNRGAGIALVSANGNTIAANYVGLAGDGLTAIGNQHSGIALFDSADNTIGAVAGRGNVISGNAEAGILFQGSGTHGNIVIAEFIGTDPDGTMARPNDFGILARQSGANTIGGVGAEEANLISGNRFQGISITGSSGFVIQNNRIGLNLPGTAALANGGNGIRLDSTFGTTIGGAASNYISGNAAAGVAIVGGGNNTIASNTIGLNGTNTAAIPNLEGIRIAGSNNTIGGTVDSANLISGNAGAGIVIIGAANRVVGNGIGVGGGGGSIIGNGGAGIEITGVGNVIGTDKPNFIAGNGGAGILIHTGAAVGDSHGNELRGNSILANIGLGIDLEPGGPTPNDPGDADDGANGLQNFPVLTGANISAGQVSITGTLNSTANGSFTIEFFSNATGGQAAFPLGSATVMTDANGVAVVAGTFAAPPVGQRVVAIATNDATHDTSEISASILPATDTPGIRIADASANETDGTLVFTVSLDAPGSSSVSVQFATLGGTALAASDFTATSGTLTFAPGETSKTIGVPVVNDSLVEPVETFSMILSAPTGGGVLADANADGTIVSDDTTLRIKGGGTIAKWRDVDGDLVTLTATKAVLDADDFVFEPRGTLGGEQLVAFHIGGDDAHRIGLAFVAKRNPASPTGDGFVHVGFLDANGLDVGAVSIDGDLGRILAGDTDATTPSIKSLTARSVGVFGTGTQDANGSTVSIFFGRAKNIAILGDVAGSLVFDGGNSSLELGTAGSITIGGDLIGGAAKYSGSIVSGGAIDSVTIAGTLRGGSLGATGIFSGGAIGALSIGAVLGDNALHPVVIDAQGLANPTARTALAIGSIVVTGSVENADIRAGFSPFGVPSSHSVAIGRVKVLGDWAASSLSAGIEPGSDGYYGDAQDTVIVPGNSIASSIAKIVIRGRLTGTPDAASTTDHYAFTASKIGAFTLGTTPIALDANLRDDLLVGTSGDVRIREV